MGGQKREVPNSITNEGTETVVRQEGGEGVRTVIIEGYR